MTAASGEINCVDAGDFGPVTIHKAITIDCAGTLGSILVPATQAGIYLNAGSNDVITLRNLSVNGGGNMFNAGIGVGIAAVVHLEHVNVSNMVGDCIDLQASGSVLLTVDDSTISNCANGIYVITESGTAAVNINNTRISKTANGIVANDGSRITITNSTIFVNNVGVFQGGGALGSTVTVVSSTLGYSAAAALQSAGGPNFILVFGNNFVNDMLVFNPNGGQIYTGGDNNSSGSTAGTANGGTLPKI